MNQKELKRVILDRDRFPNAFKALEEALVREVAPAIVVGMWTRADPDLFYSSKVGKISNDPTAPQVEFDTAFDLSSVTKVMGTAALCGILYQRRWMNWEDSVRKIIPSYPYKEIKVKHLLSHTAGLTWWKPYFQQIRSYFSPVDLHSVPIVDRQQKMRELVFASEPEERPEVKTVYSDLSFLTLGFLIEELMNLPLNEAVERYVWGPLRLNRTQYHLANHSVRSNIDSRIAPTENCPWRGGVLQGQVHDDNCWAMGGYGGHSGGFSTIENVIRFGSTLFDRFWSPEVKSAFLTRMDRPAGCGRTLGWDTPDREGGLTGGDFSPNSIGHWGFTGTSLWVDGERGWVIAVLSNRVHPSRENDRIKQWRPLFHDAIRKDAHELRI